MLLLNVNRLSGAIPEELGNLTGLTRLRLQRNRFSGTIPARMGNLTALTHLTMRDLPLTGCVPGDLSRVASNDILELGLPDCRTPDTMLDADPPACTATTLGQPRTAAGADGVVAVTGLARDCDTLLAVKAKLDPAGQLNWAADRPLAGTVALDAWDGVTVSGSPKRITAIDLTHRGLTGVIPTQLGRGPLVDNRPGAPGLSALTSLKLGFNRLTGPVPTQLGSLTALTHLDLRRNLLAGALPTQLGNLTALTTLRLTANQLSGLIPTQIGSLTALTELDASWNRLTRMTGDVGRLRALTTLRLAGNDFAGNVPAELGGLTALTELALANNPFTGCLPTGLTRTTLRSDAASLGLPACPPPMPGS